MNWIEMENRVKELEEQLTHAKAQVVGAYRDAAALVKKHAEDSVTWESESPKELPIEIEARTDKDAAAALKRIVADKVAAATDELTRENHRLKLNLVEPTIQLRIDRAALEVEAALRGVIRLYQEMNGQNPEEQRDDPDSFVIALLTLIPTGDHLKRHDTELSESMIEGIAADIRRGSSQIVEIAAAMGAHYARLLEPMDKLLKRWRSSEWARTTKKSEAEELEAALQQARRKMDDVEMPAYHGCDKRVGNQFCILRKGHAGDCHPASWAASTPGRETPSKEKT